MAFQATKNDVVLSGHGSVEIGNGETAVPGDCRLIVLAPPGASITDRLGGMVEQGKSFKKLKLSTAASGFIDFEPVIYEAGKSCPNYVLHPPTGLALKPGVPHMLGVAKATSLSELWSRVMTFVQVGQMTSVFWCACASIDYGEDHVVDFAA